jgi:carbon-monoxide dehydrogenase large subunit
VTSSDDSSIGHEPTIRREDARFLTGQGRYVDDVHLDHMVHAVVVRSPHAHARITRIDAAPALDSPGVLAVFTGEDWEASGFGPLPTRSQARFTDGSAIPVPPRPGLVDGVVRCVGDPVALVVAETPAQARDAAERVMVDYEPLPAVVDPVAALAEGAPQIWEQAPRNLCVDFESGDAAAVDAAFASAHLVARCEMVISRVHAAPMETRGAVGQHDAASGRRTLICNAQNLRANRAQLAADVLHCEPDALRLAAFDVGGGFGMKNGLYPEHALVLLAAERLGRPVKWMSERGESFLSDSHGREQRTVAELALDAQGRFLAFRVDTVGNVGAYVGSTGGFTPAGGSARTQGGLYVIPHIHYRSRVAFTNTSTTEAYRGAGRPEANVHIERVIDTAAAALGIDPTALRERNLLTPDAIPYRTPMGMTIDAGDFPALLARARELGDLEGFEARAAESRRRGLLRGLGVTTYLGLTGGGREEKATLSLAPDGGIDLYASAESIGQAHETVLPYIVGRYLGVDPARIRYHQGDTDFEPVGGGHGGSRGLEMAGSAATEAGEAFVTEARRLAAHLLEAAPDDLVFEGGHYAVAGTDRRVAMSAVLDAVADGTPFADGVDTHVHVAPVYRSPAPSVPVGAHAIEVEVDPDTGLVTIARCAMLHDVGHVVSRAFTDGQVHGAAAQGLGQALGEAVVYDDDSGQLVSGSFMDYQMPRARDFPALSCAYVETPTEANPIGVKGVGEAACGGSIPGLVNAVNDALRRAGFDARADMPLTPERVWRAMHPED